MSTPAPATATRAPRAAVAAAGMVVAAVALAAGDAAGAGSASSGPPPACRATAYLTIDTGWSREAEDIAATLRRHGVRATLFVADEPTWRGDTTLSPSWAAFWRARAAEGHAFASHTLRHWYFAEGAGPGRVRYASRAGIGRGSGSETLDAAALCAELRAPTDALRAMAPDANVLPLWRAPGGRTTPNALAMARDACGLRHQGWTANGYLGDDLPSDRQPNDALLRRALGGVRDGEVLVMHWGVRSRREPFAPALEPLLAGLRARGVCFATLPPDGVR